MYVEEMGNKKIVQILYKKAREKLFIFISFILLSTAGRIEICIIGRNAIL